MLMTCNIACYSKQFYLVRVRERERERGKTPGGAINNGLLALSLNSPPVLERIWQIDDLYVGF